MGVGSEIPEEEGLAREFPEISCSFWTDSSLPEAQPNFAGFLWETRATFHKEIIFDKIYIYGDHLFSTYAKCSKSLTFLTP